MSRVFIVHEPLAADGAPLKNLKPAERFGQLIHVVRSGPTPSDLTGLIPRMREVLHDFHPYEDYLLPIGHPILIGWATAIAVEFSIGRNIKMLLEQPRLPSHPRNSQIEPRRILDV